MEQVPDEALFATLDPESNSIAIIVKHWRATCARDGPISSPADGEKPDRNRDSEFEAPPETRAELTRAVGIQAGSSFSTRLRR